jgi:hypothetical protein
MDFGDNLLLASHVDERRRGAAGGDLTGIIIADKPLKINWNS